MINQPSQASEKNTASVAKPNQNSLTLFNHRHRFSGSIIIAPTFCYMDSG